MASVTGRELGVITGWLEQSELSGEVRSILLRLIWDAEERLQVGAVVNAALIERWGR